MVAGKKKHVCKKAFLSIRDLQNNRGRVENKATKMSKGSNTLSRDKRGFHSNLKKYTEEQINAVRMFIEKLLKYESHYSRKDNPNRMFMTKYTIESCYEVFVVNYTEKDISVSRDKFHRIFTDEFNIRFKSPKTD